MSKRKHVILTRMFEFGGSNTYLRLLDKYFAEDELFFIVDKKSQRMLFNELQFNKGSRHLLVLPGLHKVAKISFSTLVRSIKHLFLVVKSVARLGVLLIKVGTRNVIISSVEPEKYLYFLSVPFLNVKYVVHTFPEQPGYPFTSWICNAMLGERKRIIAVSNYSKDVIRKFWRISAKKERYVNVIHNTVINHSFTNRWHSNNRVIVTFGHAIEYKNPFLWLAVAKKVVALFPDVDFKWIGDGPLFRELELASAHLDRINFYKSTPSPLQYFEGCYLYYQPSRMESHGISVLEAMASSLPCVVSNVGGLPESVENGFNGFVVGNENEIDHVNAISGLLADKNLASQFSVHARQRFETSFVYQVWETKMNQLFNKKVE